MADELSRKIFAKNLRFYVNQSGKMQRTIAEDVGVTPTALSDWLAGKRYPRIDGIEKLAAYFGVRKSDLIEDRVQAPEQQQNDVLADLIIRLRTDIQFRNIVEEINDYDFDTLLRFELVLRAFRK